MKRDFCRLCKKEEELCEKSHIIPSHCYKMLKKDNYCLFVKKENINKEGKQKDYSGIFDKHILCKNCENKISKFETYGYDLIYSNKLKNIKRIKEGGKIIISGDDYNYRKIKLYYLSILWKSTLSSNSFFKEIKIDHDYFEDMGKMLLNGDPGKENEFPISIVSPCLTKEGGFNFLDISFIGNPRKIENKFVDIFYFPIIGQNIIYSISKGIDVKFNSIKENDLYIFLKNEERTISDRLKMSKQICDFYEN